MPINKGKFATILELEVNKKDEANKGKYVKVGSLNLFIPLLADAGIDAVQAKDKDGKPLVEDGIPVYETDEANWIQGAMVNAAKAQARNRLISGTATLKDGKTISDDWLTLTAESEGVGNPAALLAVREVKEQFKKWVSSLGKSGAAQSLLNALFANKQSLTLQSTETKGKVENYVTEFASSLPVEALEKGQKYIQSVMDACKPVEDATDF